MSLFRYLKGFFTRVKNLHVCFNPEMSFEARHGTIWNMHDPDPIGIRLNKPDVLISCRAKHLKEIRRQAELCDYDVTHLTTETRTYCLPPLRGAPVESSIEISAA